MKQNIITMTDSYKFLNNAFLNDVTNVHSYFEARKGADYPYTVFFGLQYLLKQYLEGVVVTREKIEDAKLVAEKHLGNKNNFNVAMWEYILDKHNGKLPIEIKAVPEGTEVPIDNVLMTVTCTDENELCAGLVNHLETLLTNVWSSCLVATKSRNIKKLLLLFSSLTSDTNDHINFQLHDFAQRSVKCPEAAYINGVGHLINFYGTDTVLAWECAKDFYYGDVNTIGYSVFASEHNYMMYRGENGEERVVGEILNNFPNGIISVVADTYNIYNFVENIVCKTYKDTILNRNGVFVVRPDSITPKHNTPELLVKWIIDTLWDNFGGTVNKKGFKVLDSHIRIIYGDGLNEDSIYDILTILKDNLYSSENIVFGCGSYLLDKHNRDTQRFAYKSSAMKINNEWCNVRKNPLGSNKTSKAGILKLVKNNNDNFITISSNSPMFNDMQDYMQTVFKNGEIVKTYTLDEIRNNINFKNV